MWRNYIVFKSKSLISDQEYQSEARKQFEWLNWVFAVVTFSVCISCLQFEKPWRVAILSLTLVGPMYIYALLGAPHDLRVLRKLRREVKKDPAQFKEVDDMVKHLESKFHGWDAVVRLIPLWLSLIIYSIIIFSFAQPFSYILWFKS